MRNTFVIIKLNSQADETKPIIRYMEESYNSKEARFYNLSVEDADELKDLSDADQFYFMGLIYHREVNAKPEIENAYLGEGRICHNEQGSSINYNMKVKLNNGLVLKNICKLTELDLIADFEQTDYLLRVDSDLVAEQIDLIVFSPAKYPRKPISYKGIPAEESLHPLAQRNEYCRRQYDLAVSKEPFSEYQRDYELITHSTSFRRMVDKAQIFSASKGDHYRTRMTHSQIVSQVSRAISAALNLNLNLTEAIALGHDIGHTPFGHQGERTLDRIFRGEQCKIINHDLLYPDGKEGFKHNYQSVRVASILEETYPNIQGMNLSFQTLEGMLKHTKLKRDQYFLSSFTNCTEDDLHYDTDFCSTLEGQVVSIADEIAQRGHDLDDALSSGALTYEELKGYLTLRKMKTLSQIIDNSLKEIDVAKNNHFRQIDQDALITSRIVSALLSYFINDVVDASRQRMTDYQQNRFISDGNIVTEQLISFSDKAMMLNNYVETIISNRVITNPEVSLFDSNAATTVSGLFKTYYNNPRLLHSGTKRRLYIEMRRISNNVIDFEFANHQIISEELELITHGDLLKIQYKNPEVFEEYREKRKILVRSICDYIAGMTDTYAKNEYDKIEKPL